MLRHAVLATILKDQIPDQRAHFSFLCQCWEKDGANLTPLYQSFCEKAELDSSVDIVSPGASFVWKIRQEGPTGYASWLEIGGGGPMYLMRKLEDC